MLNLQIEDQISPQGACIRDPPPVIRVLLEKLQLECAISLHEMVKSRARFILREAFIEVVTDNEKYSGICSVLLIGILGPDEVLTQWRSRCSEAIDPAGTIHNFYKSRL